MLAVMEPGVNGVATLPVSHAKVLATLVVLVVNPVCSPDRTAHVAGQTATWPARPTPLGEEPTWEDAEWQ